MWAPFAAHAGARELVAFDPPGAGLSQRPAPAAAHGRPRARRDGAARRARARPRRRARVLVRRRAGAGARVPRARARPAARPVRDRPGLGGIPPRRWRRSCSRAGPLLPPAAACAERPAHRGRPHRARARRARRARAARAPAPPVPDRLRLPALRGRRLVEPAVAAPGHHPTLVVSGEDDPAVPVRNGRVLAGRLPDARLHVVPAAGTCSSSTSPRTRRRSSARSSTRRDRKPVVRCSQRPAANMVSGGG